MRHKSSGLHILRPRCQTRAHELRRIYCGKPLTTWDAQLLHQAMNETQIRWAPKVGSRASGRLPSQKQPPSILQQGVSDLWSFAMPRWH